MSSKSIGGGRSSASTDGNSGTVLKTVEVEETCSDLSIPCTESTTNEAEESSKCSKSIGGGRKIVSTDGDSGTVLETVLVENETAKEEVEKFEEHANLLTHVAVENPKFESPILGEVLTNDPDKDINNLAGVLMKSLDGTEVSKEDVRNGVGGNNENHSLPVDDGNKECILNVPWKTGWDEVLPNGRKDEIAKFFIQKFDSVDWDTTLPDGWKNGVKVSFEKSTEEGLGFPRSIWLNSIWAEGSNVYNAVASKRLRDFNLMKVSWLLWNLVMLAILFFVDVIYSSG